MTRNRSTTGNGIEGLVSEAKAMAASPLIYIGAITVVAATEIIEWLPLSEFYAALAVLPIALALLYGQLAFVVLLRRRREGRRCP